MWLCLRHSLISFDVLQSPVSSCRLVARQSSRNVVGGGACGGVRRQLSEHRHGRPEQVVTARQASMMLDLFVVCVMCVLLSACQDCSKLQHPTSLPLLLLSSPSASLATRYHTRAETRSAIMPGSALSGNGPSLLLLFFSLFIAHQGCFANAPCLTHTNAQSMARYGCASARSHG